MTGKDLSDDLLICLYIFEAGQRDGKIWFGKLVDEMGLPGEVISRNLDVLSDRGMIDAEWEIVDDRWVRTYRITDDFSGFIKGLSDSLKGSEEPRSI